MISLKKLLDEGITYVGDTNNLYFDFNSDFNLTSEEGSHSILNFNLTNRSFKLYIIKGIKIFYGYYFNRNFAPKEPYTYQKKNDTQSINDARRTIKDVKTSKIKSRREELPPIIKMIDLAIDRFSQLVDLRSFTSIISAPSSSRLNDLILDRFQARVGTNIITKDALQKNEINKVAYLMDEYNKLDEKGKRLFHAVKKSVLNKDGTFEMKMVPTTMRTLFHNFISLKQNNQKGAIDVATKISEGKVLIIDDTIGSGATFLEIVREIKPLKPNEIYLFGLLQDYHYGP
jgi:hypothetical protein